MRRFGREARQVPLLPKDDDNFVGPERTCIHLLLEEGQVPADPGNAFLDLLRDRQQVDEAAPIAVNETEMSVETTVCGGPHFCNLKMHLYAEEAGPTRACAAELQCLGGNELVFLRFFQLARQYLEEQGWLLLGGDEAAAAESELWRRAPGLGCILQAPRPRGQIAASIHVPDEEDLQAESAVALAFIAEDPSERRHLLNLQVFEKIRKLLKSDLMGVAWPTTLLLEALKGMEPKPEQLARFLEGLRRDELQVKVRSDYTPAAVQKLLMRTFFREGLRGVQTG